MTLLRAAGGWHLPTVTLALIAGAWAVALLAGYTLPGTTDNALTMLVGFYITLVLIALSSIVATLALNRLLEHYRTYRSDPRN